MSQLVSIIIPCFNGECFIDRCFESIEIQNYSDIEVIVVNDGSTDQSEDKILNWKQRLNNRKISLIYVKQYNQGPGSAVNLGLKYVSGEYLTLLDVDDEYLPGAISERVEYLNIHNNVDVVRSNGWYVRENGKSLFVYEKSEKKNKVIFEELLKGNTNNWAGSYMVRVSALFEAYPDRNIYTSKYGQNLQILLPLVYKKKCGFIDQPHMNYNQQNNSLTKTKDEEKRKDLYLENAKGYREIREHMIELIVKEEYEKKLYMKVVETAYCRNIMKIASELRNRSLMKKSFTELKNKNKDEMKIEDYILYYSLIFPPIMIALRLFRKIKSEFIKKRND